MNPLFPWIVAIALALPVMTIAQSEKKQKAISAAQVPNMEFDSTYYVSYEKLVTSRFYFSQKYTALNFRNLAEKYSITYQPNTTLNMGVGATYKWATLNLAYGFGFLNPDRGQGKTKYLDLQLHSYGRKVILDLFGQFYNGFYLTENDIKTSEAYYQRPDLRVREVGASLQYVFNNRRFSYRSSMHQNEWQKKSAGTVIAGVEILYGIIDADSSIVPRAIDPTPAAPDIYGSRFFEVGPSLGYAYTLVIKKHFFITASASASLNYGSNTFFLSDSKTHAGGFSPNYFVRGFAGYNSDKWAISVVFVSNNVSLMTGDREQRVFVNTGNARLNFVYRLVPSNKVKRFFRWL